MKFLKWLSFLFLQWFQLKPRNTYCILISSQHLLAREAKQFMSICNSWLLFQLPKKNIDQVGVPDVNGDFLKHVFKCNSCFFQPEMKSTHIYIFLTVTPETSKILSFSLQRLHCSILPIMKDKFWGRHGRQRARRENSFIARTCNIFRGKQIKINRHRLQVWRIKKQLYQDLGNSGVPFKLN